jgi:pyruvate/2-oxoglutarate dehydrogenase complex dihydrolipoamide acyltransferase (E2) component
MRPLDDGHDGGRKWGVPMLRYAQAHGYRADTKCPVPSEGGSETVEQQHADYQVVPYPKYRRWMVAALRSTHHKPMIHGLLEVDVSEARARLRNYRANTGESLSFTAFLIACLAKAVDENKAVQAFRLGSKRLILFDDVDVLTDIERDVAGQKFVVPHIVRARATQRDPGGPGSGCEKRPEAVPAFVLASCAL